MEPASQVTVAVVLAVGLGLFAAERFTPLRRATRPLVGRVAINLAVSALAYAAALAVVRPAVVAAFGEPEAGPLGLLGALSLPPAVEGLIAFLLMDLSFYYWHLLNHRLAWLWRFHNVHHFDPDLDVSTAFRFHFGEILLSAVLRVVQVLVIGLSGWTYAAYEVLFQANTLFQHSNVRLPIGIERLLNRVLVTPRMHGIHHSQVQRETNSNYGVVFPWWDRLHRTLVLNVPQAVLTIGVPAYSLPEDNRVWPALSAPFRRQRDYWRTPDGLTVSREGDVEAEDSHRLAD